MAGDLKQLSRDEYHVAWICPVADLELLPACLMLDEEHDAPQYDTHYDENTYVCGSIYGHAVVIGTLPAGETGNVNASKLAGSMIKTFSNIRMVLLVGIGGGIPHLQSSENALDNIHLGDVVVGWPGDGGQACIYYGRGRRKAGEEFEIVGTIQNPDWRLTNALAVLEKDYALAKTSLSEHLARLNHVQRGRVFAHPGLEHDKLFKAAYHHTGGYYSRCVDCDRNELVSRPQRSLDNQHTFVFHSGRIATGDAVIQNAEQRDRIRSMCDGALCVDMEAAGVNVNKPCLVIRGISDYADTHKSDIWRNYAAGKAAAFARELLRKVPCKTAEKKKPRETMEKRETEEAHEAPWLVPLPRPPSYVGREVELSKLSAHISSTDCPRLAIFGLGGCGKTALVLETAYLVRETQPLRPVFWVPAVSQDSFEQAFRGIGKQLRIPNITDAKSNMKELVKEKLSDESIGPWLMIIDNADDWSIFFRPLGEESSMNRLIDYLPHSRKGSIIFTTRTRQVAVDLAGSNVVELGKLDETEAKELLRTRLLSQNRHQVENDAIVGEFLNILAFFALAIVQAAAYINKTDNNLSTYVRLYKDNEQTAIKLLSKEFEDQGRYRETRNSIATTWYISFEQIRRHDKLAAEYLSFMACTTNTNIPASMLPEPNSEMDQIEALGILKAYGFITKRQLQVDEKHELEAQEHQIETFDIHPLVHLATRTWLKSQDEWRFWVGKTVERMQKLIPFGNIRTRKVWIPYLPHARQVCDLSKPDHAELWANLIKRIARCHQALGQYRVAEQEFRKLLAYEEKTLGEKHQETLRSWSYIGLTLHHQRKYIEAEQMHRRTLLLREEVLGKEHHDTLSSMNKIAMALENQGEYSEAEKMYRQVLAVTERVSGEDHTFMLACMHNIAGALNRQGKHTEADDIYGRALELKRKGFGKEQPGVFMSMSFLARTLSRQRKYQEAEEIYRKILEFRKELLGEKHSETLNSMGSLAITLRRQRKYQEAEELFRKLRGLSEKELGMEHEYTLRSAWEVGFVLREQHRYEEALPFYERAHRGLEKTLGANHSDTRSCAEEYALAQRMAGGWPSDSEDASLSDEL